MAVTMTYGDHSFSPIPLVTLSKSYNRTGDGTKLGTIFRMTLDGQLTPLPNSAAGISNNIALLDTFREKLTLEGCAFVIQCDSTVLWSGHPRITSDISFPRNNNNWVDTINYSLDLEFDVEGSGEDLADPPYIESASENWSLSFADTPSKFSWTLPTKGVDENPYILNMSHNISAKGKRHFIECDTVDKEPWEFARQYVIDKLSSGADSAFDAQLEGSGVINLSAGLFTSYNHARIQNTDKLGGSYAVTENWLVMNTGAGIPGNSVEDFTANVNQAYDNDLTTISIDGTIQGVETRTYGSNPNEFSITQTKYSAASGYWATVATRLYYRAKLLHTNAVAGKQNIRSLNTDAISSSVGHGLTRGSISYSYTYNDRPSTCITGALTESISIVDNNPTDVFAQIAVLGRALGPVLQDVNTITVPTKDVSIELVTAPSTATTAATLITPSNHVKTDVATLLCGFQTELSGVYDQVFKNMDRESWNPREGRYSRSVSWSYQACAVTGDTSLCS